MKVNFSLNIYFGNLLFLLARYPRKAGMAEIMT
jgi:hypothetical protein